MDHQTLKQQGDNMKNTTFALTTSLLAIFFILFMPSESRCFEIPDTSPFVYSLKPKTISMDFKNASLNDVLKIFSQQSGLNFIASSSISNLQINLYLDEVPVEEALERILSANNLTYEISPGSNIFLVKKQDKPEKQLLTRVYQLKHASVSSAKINSTLSSEGSTSSPSSSSSSSSSSASSSTSTGGIIPAINALLTQSGTLTEDPRTNSIIVTDIPDIFPLIEQTIARLDIRIPQILIEAEMLDVSKGTSELIGAKWGSTPLTFSGGKRTDFYPFDSSKIIREAEIAMDERYTESTLSFEGLSATLQFLRTRSDTKNLARPRIMTLNNETAQIEISTNEAIGANLSSSGEGGSAITASTAERVQTGVFLKVTPQANIQTREITIAIEPKVIQARTGAAFEGKTFKDPEERGSKSILRIKDGDTVIIGGLLRSDFSETKTKVPVLGSIPVVGNAFKHKDNIQSERELIVFITPHIIQEDIDFADAEKSRQKIVREQNSPLTKLNTINRELSSLDGQTRF